MHLGTVDVRDGAVHLEAPQLRQPLVVDIDMVTIVDIDTDVTHWALVDVRALGTGKAGPSVTLLFDAPQQIAIRRPLAQVWMDDRASPRATSPLDRRPMIDGVSVPVEDGPAVERALVSAGVAHAARVPTRLRVEPPSPLWPWGVAAGVGVGAAAWLSVLAGSLLVATAAIALGWSVRRPPSGITRLEAVPVVRR